MRADLEPPPVEGKGAMYVATDKEIDVGIEGTEKVAKKNVCGFYLVHRNDMVPIMKAYKEAPEKEHKYQMVLQRLREVDPTWKAPMNEPIPSSEVESKKTVVLSSQDEVPLLSQ